MSHLEIWNTCYKLLTQKKISFNRLSVHQICEALGIHRSTFYRHFESKGDLLKWGLSYEWDAYFQNMNRHQLMHPFQTAHDFMNGSRAHALIQSQQSDMNVLQEFKTILLSRLEHDYRPLFKEDADYYAMYVVSVIDFLDQWNESLSERHSYDVLDAKFEALILPTLMDRRI